MNDPLREFNRLKQHVVTFVTHISVLVSSHCSNEILGWADFIKEREERVINTHIKRVKVLVLASAGSDVEATVAGRSTKERARPHHPTGSMEHRAL